MPEVLLPTLTIDQNIIEKHQHMLSQLLFKYIIH